MTNGEGIRELMPDSTVSATDLFFTYGYSGGEPYTNFGLMNCPANYRLYIHVKNPGESILMGMNTVNHYSLIHYNLRKPDGSVALSGTCPFTDGQTGYIRYYRQAIKGPFPSIGGYNPLVYQVNNIADTGNYYFEISNIDVCQEADLPLWDFQVVSGAHTTALPSDTINGRVWSQSWQFQADLSTYRTFNGRLFVLSNDGIVTKLKFTNARVGVVTIFCNPTGCYDTGNPFYDRQSWPTNTFSNFPGIAQYKVFLNNPDTTVYPSGVFGSITGGPSLIPDTAFPPCSGEKKVIVDVSKAGNAEVDLFFPYGAPATNVGISSPVVAGTNYISWDGKDGLGNPVPDGTLVTVRVIYINGLTNLPIWDQEQNPGGYKINLLRPYNPVSQIPLVFWDDSNITEGGCPNTIDLTGCVPFPTGCHVWSGYDCHDKMINTWWYGSSDTAVAVSSFSGAPPVAVGHDSTRCGPGSVVLHATVPANETVDWYDTISGGNPLLVGDTTFVTPFISMSTTFFAEARNDSSNCTSVIRTPVNAIVKPLPVPSLTGPQHVCIGSFGNLYTTDPFMTNYFWTVTPGGLITGGYLTDSIFVTWMLPGIQQVSINYTDMNGCRGARPTRLFVLVTPKPDTAGPISGPQEICAGTNSVLYSIAPIPYANFYKWTVPAKVILVSGAGTDSITVDFPPDAQSGNFSVYASDSCGDGVPSIYPVTVYQPPVANAGPDDSICQDQLYQVTRAAASDYKSLLWTTTGQGSLTDDTTLSPTYNPAPGETGPVSLILTVYGKANCGPDTSRMTLQIKSAPILSAGSDASVCEGRSFQIPNAFALNYQSLLWTTSGTGHFSDPQQINPVYFPGNDEILQGYAMLTLYASPYAPCLTGSDSMKLTIQEAPVVNAGPGAVTCETLPVIIIGASASNYDSLLWTHNGQGTLTGEKTLSPVYLPAAGDTGNIFLLLTAYGKEACSDSVVRSQTGIHIYPPVTANAGSDRLIAYGSSDTLSGSFSGGSGKFKYRWDPAFLLLDSISLNPVTVSLIADTIFILTVTDNLSGCRATDTVRISVRKPAFFEPDCIVVHNVITPNGDGLNDLWIIDCIEEFPDNQVKIFNRWGDLINSYNHYDNVQQVWKGTNFEDKPIPDGTYYYLLTIKDMKPRTGWVLVRGGR